MEVHADMPLVCNTVCSDYILGRKPRLFPVMAANLNVKLMPIQFLSLGKLSTTSSTKKGNVYNFQAMTGKRHGCLLLLVEGGVEVVPEPGGGNMFLYGPKSWLASAVMLLSQKCLRVILPCQHGCLLRRSLVGSLHHVNTSKHLTNCEFPRS